MEDSQKEERAVVPCGNVASGDAFILLDQRLSNKGPANQTKLAVNSVGQSISTDSIFLPSISNHFSEKNHFPQSFYKLNQTIPRLNNQKQNNKNNSLSI